MRQSKLFFGFFFISVILCSFNSNTEKAIIDFSLINVDSSIVSTKDYDSAKGFIVIFTCNHCPFAKLYTKRMNDLNAKFASLGVPLLAINSMDSMLYEDETFKLMQEKAKREAYNFPYLHDASQAVARQFGAEHTPMAFVIWKVDKKWWIKYKGAIDDNGEHPEEAMPFVENAVNELLKHENVSNPVTESFGCRIFFRE